MKTEFLNKTVLVTGGTRGIGAAIVKQFYDLNANVLITGTDRKLLEKLNDSSGSRLKYLYLDFTSTQSIKGFILKLEKYNQIDVLVNNAGVNKIDSIDNIIEEDWDNINNVNLKGPFQITKTVSKVMKKNQQGRIVNISSIFGVVSKAMRASYSTTKWGLVGFTKAVAVDLAPYNILVNAVSPGFIDTELTRKILGNNGIKEVVKSVPLKRLAAAEEVARLVVFLSGNQNSYITGQNIIIDGGFTSV
mgnify:FL=1